jgi:capsular polysaccharide biosynthesis protein
VGLDPLNNNIPTECPVTGSRSDASMKPAVSPGSPGVPVMLAVALLAAIVGVVRIVSTYHIFNDTIVLYRARV